MREYDAYLFDADGTIIDTRELIYQSWVEMARRLKVTLPERDHVEAQTGLPVGTNLRRLVGDDRPDEFYEEAMGIYRNHMMEVYPDFLKPLPGVKEGLSVLAGMGKKLAVVTSRRLNTLEIFLRVLGIDSFFDVLVTPEDTAKHKPDPEPALFALEALGAEPGRTLFVGDAEFDVCSGSAAGTDTAYLAWARRDCSRWPVRPDYVVTSFGELLPPQRD